jgi:hypothetical protein
MSTPAGTRRTTAVRTRPQRPMSASRRKTLATEELLRTLETTDQTAALTAVLEAVNDQLNWDTAFRQKVRQRFEELTALSAPKQKVDLGPAPTPISGRGTAGYSGFAKLNPYHLLDEYGRDQLRAVLERMPQRRLREAVDSVQEREPSTRPSSRSRNADMIDYIMEHVAGPGY